jgi:ABC-type multidrug transport system fused ATPase/permease subunit
VRLYLRLLRYTGRRRGLLVASLVAAVAVGVLNTLTFATGLPFLRVLLGQEVAADGGSIDAWSARVIDAMRGAFGTSKGSLLLAFLGVFVVLTALKALFRFLQDAWTAALTRRTVLDVAEEVFGKALRQPIGFYERQGIADATARFTTDVDFLSAGLGVVLSKLVREPLKVIGMVWVAAAIDVPLTAITLLVFPVVFGAAAALARRIRRRARGVLEARSSMMGAAAEALGGLRTVQAFGGEEAHEERFRERSARLYREDRRLTRTDALTSPLLETTAAIGVAAALAAGLPRIVAMDPAAFLALYAALLGTLDPLRKLGDVGNRISLSGAAAERLFALLDRVPEIRDVPGARTLASRGGAVVFEDVRYAYPDGREALRGISFAVEPGWIVAVVGPSGAGKSTLLDLIPRLRDPASGRVLQDGVDLARATVASVRARCALVHQHPDLFDGTIHENVALGRAGASRAEVEAACRRAHAHEFVAAMPEGYETRLAPGGVGLSGGQRQRLALARAVLRDPAVLLLDEPTSALDRESEDLLRAALADFLPGRTVFVIAHRPGTVERADRVLVLREGRVEAFGSPPEVLASSPTYRRLWAQGFEEPNPAIR